jgi:hypothetical protein
LGLSVTLLYIYNIYIYILPLHSHRHSPLNTTLVAMSSQVLSPPPFTRRISARNTRLTLPARPEDPPIPPRLIGSPLLDKLNSAYSVHAQPRAQWIDGNEFGTSSSTSTSPLENNKLKRSSRQAPPPEPRFTSPPPPLPPLASNSSSRHSTHTKSAQTTDLLPSSQRCVHHTPTAMRTALTLAGLLHSPRQIVT